MEERLGETLQQENYEVPATVLAFHNHQSLVVALLATCASQVGPWQACLPP